MPEHDELIRSGFEQLAGAQLPVPSASAVVGRGTQRRRRRRATQAVSAAAATAIVAAGAGYLAGTGHTGLHPSVSHGRRRPALCTAAPSAALSAELRRPRRIGQGRQNYPIAMFPSDPARAYVQTDTPAFRGIAAVNVATGAIVTRVLRLPARDMGLVAGGVGPSGELLWTSMIGTAGNEAVAWTPMHMWSPGARKVTQLEPAGQAGGALSGPVFAHGDTAAWLQADGRRREIVEANLVTGAMHVIARGYLGAPVFVGNALVWPASSRPLGQPSRLVATAGGALPSTHVAVPAALRTAGSATLIASSGLETAYVSADLKELYYSPSPDQPARLARRLGNGDYFDPSPPVLGPGYLGWTTSQASWLASTASFAVARVTAFGALWAAGSYVWVLPWTGSKTAPYAWRLVTAATVNGLTCGS